MYNNKSLSYWTTLLLAVLFMACGENKKPENVTISSKPVEVTDHHTLSNYKDIKIKHLDLDLTVDFAQKSIQAMAAWQFENIAGTDSLVLDTDELQVDSVLLDDGSKANFVLATAVPMNGSALKIAIKKTTQSVKIFYKVLYNEADTFAALQWLEPAQTFGKKHPFLFTKSEPTMSRCWIPAQDLPAVKFTYNATVHVPKGLMALMSASNPQEKTADGVYHFEMKQPIPVYLLALAVGDIAFRSIDGRTGVYAEPVMVEKCQNELSEMPQMLTAAEQIIGPYQWERYDVLILPLGFPIGGMENPRLTFSTPTIIAGDKSLVALIAHELAHSWSGNEVTNATWNDLWLNEGFTVYFERRIMEAIRGKDYADMLWTIGRQDLDYTLEKLGPKNEMTKLALNLDKVSPLESFSDIAYEKGAHFLWLIEKTVGRVQMDSFIQAYVRKYSFKSVSTKNFIEDLEEQLLSKNPTWRQGVNYIEWVFNPGLPANCPVPGKLKFGAVDSHRILFESQRDVLVLQTQEWSTHEWLHFLRNLSEQLQAKDLAALDKKFKLTQIKNSEIACAWFVQCIKHQYTSAFPAMEHFLINTGREKFLEPLYLEMMKQPTTQTLAKQIFEKGKNNYHPNVRKNMRAIVEGKL